MQAPSPSLTAENLACRRGDRLLFRRLSFALQGGAACHVTGANGAGKTTLIRAAAGLTTPYAGEVQREGALALLEERTGLDPDLPLGKALAFLASCARSAHPSLVALLSRRKASTGRPDLEVRAIRLGELLGFDAALPCRSLFELADLGGRAAISIVPEPEVVAMPCCGTAASEWP